MATNGLDYLRLRHRLLLEVVGEGTTTPAGSSPKDSPLDGQEFRERLMALYAELESCGRHSQPEPAAE